MNTLSQNFKAQTYIVVLKANNGPEYQRFYNGMGYLFDRCGINGDPTQPGVRRGSFNDINKSTGVTEVYIKDPALLQELTPEVCAFIESGPVPKPNGAMGG